MHDTVAAGEVDVSAKEAHRPKQRLADVVLGEFLAGRGVEPANDAGLKRDKHIALAGGQRRACDGTVNAGGLLPADFSIAGEADEAVGLGFNQSQSSDCEWTGRDAACERDGLKRGGGPRIETRDGVAAFLAHDPDSC